MTYSCAIFSDLDRDLREEPLLWISDHKIRQLRVPSRSPPFELASPVSDTPTSHIPSTLPTPLLEDTLAEAQQRKLAHVVARARISPGHRVLEIGSGWGSMALYIVRHIPDVQIDAITLSEDR